MPTLSSCFHANLGCGAIDPQKAPSCLSLDASEYPVTKYLCSLWSFYRIKKSAGLHECNSIITPFQTKELDVVVNLFKRVS